MFYLCLKWIYYTTHRNCWIFLGRPVYRYILTVGRAAVFVKPIHRIISIWFFLNFVRILLLFFLPTNELYCCYNIHIILTYAITLRSDRPSFVGASLGRMWSCDGRCEARRSVGGGRPRCACAMLAAGSSAFRNRSS